MCFEVYRYKLVFKSADSKHSNILEPEFKNSFGKMINSTKMQKLHDRKLYGNIILIQSLQT